MTITVITLLKRREGMSKDDFIAYYEESHRRIGEQVLSGYATRYVRRYLFPTDGEDQPCDAAGGKYDGRPNHGHRPGQRREEPLADVVGIDVTDPKGNSGQRAHPRVHGSRASFANAACGLAGSANPGSCVLRGRSGTPAV